MMKTGYLFLVLLIPFRLSGQTLPDRSKLQEYRSHLAGIDSLMHKGILTEEVTGMQYFTGYSYKTLYDWDQYFEALVQIYMGWPSTYIKNGVIIFLENEQESGMISRSVPSNEWHDPEHVKPFLSQIALLVYKAYGEKDWILQEPYFTKLKKYLDFWLVDMDINKNGLSEWMSAPHTGMDNQHERAGFWRDRNCEGVDLNSYLVKECRAFAKLARLAGKEKMASEYEAKAKERVLRIRELLWDEKDGFYYDRKAYKDQPVSKTVWAFNGMNARAAGQYKIPVRSVSAFTTLWAGVATPEQAKRMINDYLLNPREFWSPYPIATLSKSEPGYSTVSLPTDMGCSWRANTWMPTNYMVYHGLKFYGYPQIATVVARRTNELMLKAGNREYYNSETGEGVGLDPFWGWSLLGHFFSLEEDISWDLNSDE
jgi:putative isomerase